MDSVPRPGRLVQSLAVVLVVGLGLHVAHTVFELGGADNDALDTWLTLTVSTGATALCAAYATGRRPDRAAWISITAGLGSWAIGDAIFILGYGGEAGAPTIADIFYLGLYPALGAGLVLMVRPHLRDLGLWLDGLLGGLMLAGIAVAIALEQIPDTAEDSSAALWSTLGYPIGDLLLLGFVAAVFTVTGFRPGLRWGVLGAGLVVIAVADTVFTYAATTGSYEVGTALDSLWPAALLLIALSAWVRPAPVPVGTAARWPAFLAGAFFATIGIAFMVVDHHERLPTLALWLVVPAMFVRVVRTGITFTDMSRALRSAQVAAALVEASGDAVFRTDRDGRVRTWNAGAADTFGHPSGAVVGRPLAELIAPRSARRDRRPDRDGGRRQDRWRHALGVPSRRRADRDRHERVADPRRARARRRPLGDRSRHHRAAADRAGRAGQQGQE